MMILCSLARKGYAQTPYLKCQVRVQTSDLLHLNDMYLIQRPRKHALVVARNKKVSNKLVYFKFDLNRCFQGSTVMCLGRGLGLFHHILF
jgi:hypothetical protein